MAIKISAIVVARDEEAMIGRCLQSLSFCEETIVVIDDRTTDKTADIARKHGALVKEATFHDFSQIKNYALGLASCPWTLLIDADEAASTELATELRTIEPGIVSAYYLPIRNYIGKHWLRHGGLFPDYKLRLLKTGLTSYTGVVHEVFRLPKECKTAKLTGPLEHATYKNYGELFSKVRKYAPLEGVGVKKSLGLGIVNACKKFVRVFLLQKGFLDGKDGLIHAVALSYYQFLKYKP